MRKVFEKQTLSPNFRQYARICLFKPHLVNLHEKYSGQEAEIPSVTPDQLKSNATMHTPMLEFIKIKANKC